MKFIQACLSDRKDHKRKFHLCGGPAKLVPACLSGRKELHDGPPQCRKVLYRSFLPAKQGCTSFAGHPQW